MDWFLYDIGLRHERVNRGVFPTGSMICNRNFEILSILQYVGVMFTIWKHTCSKTSAHKNKNFMPSIFFYYFVCMKRITLWNFPSFFFQQAVSGTFEIGISNFENLLIWWTDAASSTFSKVFM